LEFFELCRDHGTKVITEAEGALATETAMGKFLLTIMAAIAELEREQACERSASARAIRRERGDQMGQPPIGFKHVRDDSGRIVRAEDPERPLAPIIGAYREAGTVLGAARLLNERGIPAPKGGRWYTSALTRVLEENAPGLLPSRGASGQRIKASATLSQLVRCHCGHVMTPNTHRRQLYCSRGHVTPDHGRYVVSEAGLMPWVREEASRLRTPASIDLGAADGRRDAIEAKRVRVIESYMDGLIDKAGRDAKLTEVAVELSKLDAQARIVEVPTIDWSWPAADLNAVLRAVFNEIQLSADMRPTTAIWNVPEWRAHVGESAAA